MEFIGKIKKTKVYPAIKNWQEFLYIVIALLKVNIYLYWHRYNMLLSKGPVHILGDAKALFWQWKGQWGDIYVFYKHVRSWITSLPIKQ